jgi:hypothetical protein
VLWVAERGRVGTGLNVLWVALIVVFTVVIKKVVVF